MTYTVLLGRETLLLQADYSIVWKPAWTCLTVSTFVSLDGEYS